MFLLAVCNFNFYPPFLSSLEVHSSGGQRGQAALNSFSRPWMN